jgi:hypothetical protein
MTAVSGNTPLTERESITANPPVSSGRNAARWGPTRPDCRCGSGPLSQHPACCQRAATVQLRCSYGAATVQLRCSERDVTTGLRWGYDGVTTGLRRGFEGIRGFLTLFLPSLPPARPRCHRPFPYASLFP